LLLHPTRIPAQGGTAEKDGIKYVWKITMSLLIHTVMFNPEY